MVWYFGLETVGLRKILLEYSPCQFGFMAEPVSMPARLPGWERITRRSDWGPVLFEFGRYGALRIRIGAHCAETLLGGRYWTGKIEYKYSGNYNRILTFQYCVRCRGPPRIGGLSRRPQCAETHFPVAFGCQGPRRADQPPILGHSVAGSTRHFAIISRGH
jgi:hypothetical protein